MTDEELLLWLRVEDTNLTDFAADRIEALIEESGRRLALARSEGVARVEQFERTEALTEQLAAARQDAKEAEAYAEELEDKLAKAVEALAPLAAIADAFDANELDDEARKFWGQHSFNTTPHEDIELYQGRGGRQLLTLANCMFARTTLAEIKGESND